MRLLRILALVTTLLVACTSTALAYELRLVQTTPGGTIGSGSEVSFDLFLDTQGESNIVLISVGLSYDPTLLLYEPSLSDAADFVLYAPAGGKGSPATWLEPVNDPMGLWVAPEPGREQVMFDFWETNLGGLPVISTTATATNEYMATVTFSHVGAGDWAGGLRFDLDHNGNVFTVGNPLTNVEEITGQVGTSIVFTPEPSTALLLGLGLAGLARSGRRQTIGR